MNRLIANTVTCTLIGLLFVATMAQTPDKKPAVSPSQAVRDQTCGNHASHRFILR